MEDMTDNLQFQLSHNIVTIKLTKNYTELGEKKYSLIFYLYTCGLFNICTNDLRVIAKI